MEISGISPAGVDLEDRSSKDKILARLPPLPDPDYSEQNSESLCGNTLVFIIIAVICGLSFGVSLNVGDLPDGGKIACIVTIATCAGIAVISLAGLFWGDPGIIKRSVENSFPMPSEVSSSISTFSINPRGFNPGRNIRGTDGRTYCTRCFVWRGADGHHCRTCQRCVDKFDHHCGVFGRCIAGDYKSGNMPFFGSLIAIGCFSGIAGALFLVWSLIRKFD